MKSFIKIFFTITAFSFLTKLLSFVLKIFLSREIGAEAIGMIQVASSICMVFSTLSSSGFGVIISKKTSENEVKYKEHTFALVTASILISLLVTTISIILVFVFSSLIKNFTSDTIFNLLILMLPCLFATSISCALNGYFWGLKKHFENSFSEFFEQFLRTILCVVLILTAKDYIQGAIRAVVSMSLACVIATIFTLVMYFKIGGKLKKPSKKDFCYLIKSSLPLTLVKFISSFTHPIIAIIVPLKLESMGFSSSESMSMFGIMQGMTMSILFMPMMLISPLSTILTPDLVRLYSKQKYAECEDIINTNISFSLFITCLIFPIFAALGKSIGIFLFDNELCGIYLSQSAWLMIPAGLSSITSSILNVLDLEKEASKNYIIGTIVLILSSFVLPNYFDIMSIPISMGLSMIISSILNFFIMKKKLKFSPPILKNLINYLLVGLPTFIISNNICKIMINYFTNFYTLLIASIIGIIFYILICFIFKILNVKVITSFGKVMSQNVL